MMSWEQHGSCHQQPQSDDGDDRNTLKLTKAVHMLSPMKCAERLGDQYEETQVAIAMQE